ncbi:MAG: hypothetical protein HYT49_01020 [Candidatus Wildermuthbacteria bacterium]|nr:hypothetical protein [Candidatus Wildermuthbacteria bacterium]
MEVKKPMVLGLCSRCPRPVFEGDAYVEIRRDSGTELKHVKCVNEEVAAHFRNGGFCEDP